MQQYYNRIFQRLLPVNHCGDINPEIQKRNKMYPCNFSDINFVAKKCLKQNGKHDNLQDVCLSRRLSVYQLIKHNASILTF